MISFLSHHEKTFLKLAGNIMIPFLLALPVILANDPTSNLSVIFNMPQFYFVCRLACFFAYLVFLRLVFLIDRRLLRFAYATGLATLACLMVPYGRNQFLDTLHVFFAYGALVLGHMTGTFCLKGKPRLYNLLQAALTTAVAICVAMGGICGMAEAIYGMALSITLANAMP